MLKHLLLGLALTCAMGAFATEGVNDKAVEIFGKEDAEKRIEKGCVFIDGLFVRAPYAVTREGNVILINGQIAYRFKVEADVAKDAPENGDKAAVTGGDNADPKAAAPTAPSEKKKQPNALDKRKADTEKKETLKKAAKGSFNQNAVVANPMALFEEADYTYTPPKKAEAKAVPYVRPGTKKSLKEEVEAKKKKKEETAIAKAKEAEAKAAAKVVANKQAEAKKEVAEEKAPEEVVVIVEDFDKLSDEDVNQYMNTFSEHRAKIEKALVADNMLYFSTPTSGMKMIKRDTAWKFVLSLEELCTAANAGKLQAKWKELLPKAHLQKVYDNRDANTTAIKGLVLRIKKEQKNAAERKKNRL